MTSSIDGENPSNVLTISWYTFSKKMFFDKEDEDQDFLNPGRWNKWLFFSLGFYMKWKFMLGGVSGLGFYLPLIDATFCLVFF